MAATTKLIVYNDALRMLSSAPLADTTTANVKQQELNGAFDHAVEHVLGKIDWNFARRRATLTGVADTSFAPFTYRYDRPSEYLRKVWIKADADDEFQIEHAETGASIYGFDTSAVIEYMSEASSNYDPANWPPSFTKMMAIYLALLVGPKIARAGADDINKLYSQFDAAMLDAERLEAVWTLNADIPANRVTPMRRAIEMIGQEYQGSVSMQSQADQLRWQMNKSWTHAVRYVLERGAWNFASKRALFVSGHSGDASIPHELAAGIIEGYSVPPADTAANVPISGYEFSYPIPLDFLHKIWIKATVANEMECGHQRLGDYIFTNHDPCVMEYVAETTFSTDPDNWPAVFTEAVAAYLAFVVSPELVVEDGSRGGKVKAPQIRTKLETNFQRKLQEAKNADAMQQQAKVLPLGLFARARMGGSLRRSN